MLANKRHRLAEYAQGTLDFQISLLFFITRLLSLYYHRPASTRSDRRWNAFPEVRVYIMPEECSEEIYLDCPFSLEDPTELSGVVHNSSFTARPDHIVTYARKKG